VSDQAILSSIEADFILGEIQEGNEFESDRNARVAFNI
jgi:hypothetical protein